MGKRWQKMTTTDSEKVVGILGGMGPEATVDLMQRIIRLTPARDDIDHVRCIVDNNPKVPSRIKALIEGNGMDPGPCMADMGRRLESWGADFLVIACNTAHYYYPQVDEATEIPVINLIDLVVRRVRAAHPEEARVGILASTAVIMTGLYEERLREQGAEPVYPDELHQERLFKVITDIKAGNTGPGVREAFAEVCLHLAGKGAKVAVIACTELSVIGDDLPVETVDAAEVLAGEIVAVAKGKPLTCTG